MNYVTVVVGAFSMHYETSRRFVDSSILQSQPQHHEQADHQADGGQGHVSPAEHAVAHHLTQAARERKINCVKTFISFPHQPIIHMNAQR